jgi:hypothetical protein
LAGILAIAIAPKAAHGLVAALVQVANTAANPAVPKINETVMLDTKDRREFLRQIAAVGESAQPAPGRMKLPTLVVLKGSTDRHEYTLSHKLTVVGKSAMATVKLKGWFKPKAAAQINRREDDSYYIGPTDKVPSVNGTPITHPTKLASGDVIEVAGVELEFVVRDRRFCSVRQPRALALHSKRRPRLRRRGATPEVP